MSTILACPEPDDAHDPDQPDWFAADSANEVLERTGYGTSSNGHNGHNGHNSQHGHERSADRPRCPHGQQLLSAADILTAGGADPNRTLAWCPPWCATIGRHDPDIDPHRWVHRSKPYTLDTAAGGLIVEPDGAQMPGFAQVTVRAEQHPGQRVLLTLGIIIGNVEHLAALTVAEARLIHAFQTLVCEDLQAA